MTRIQSSGKTLQTPPWKTALACLLFFTIAFVVLIMPDYPTTFRLSMFLRLQLEVPLLAVALLLLPRRWAAVLAVISTLVVATLLFLKIADIGVLSAFQRRFNPYLDIKMIGDGWNVLSGSIGTLSAVLAIALVFGAFFAVIALFFWAQLTISRMQWPASKVPVLGFGGMFAIGLVLWPAFSLFGVRGVVEMRAVPYLVERISLVSQSMADMKAFDSELNGPGADISGKGLFGAVGGRDVVLIFVESYGRSAIEDPRYGPLIEPRLEAVEHQLSKAGFAQASGWLRSPTVGGLSWLAHGTFLSGLWVDNQARYDRLMLSDWPSLNRLFGEAGWQTDAVMPAITMAWPEASYFGYDHVYTSTDLGYRGKPFNWVTMPDQYTLSAFERRVRQPAHAKGQSVMAEIALISSHAPWTPVPELIDWNDVGDGHIFDEQATSGDPPAIVWSDLERVRRQYIETIDYSLQTLGSYIARDGGDAVFVILGDHQPASIITGPDASRDVPIHIVSRDKALISRFETDGFSSGMTPARDDPAPGMDTIRARLIRLLAP